MPNGLMPQLRDTIQGMVAVRESGVEDANYKVELYEALLATLEQIITIADRNQ